MAAGDKAAESAETQCRGGAAAGQRTGPGGGSRGHAGALAGPRHGEALAGLLGGCCCWEKGEVTCGGRALLL